MRRQLIVVTLLVLGLRLPFLQQAIQGDDLYYLYGAEHAQVDPWHPTHAKYAFLGRIVDMRGNSHPPLDSWILGGLLAVEGRVQESTFHAAYIAFSLLAAWSALCLARRFSSQPLLATLLFLATPVFVVNGNSLETDVPFTAFWLTSIALYARAAERRSLLWLSGAVLAMVAAIFTAYQAILLLPLLFLYKPNWKAGWVSLLIAPAAMLGWQLYERSSSGALPAVMLSGYMQTYGMQEFGRKIRNAVALTVHLGWIIFPLLPVVAFGARRGWQWVVAAGAAAGAGVFDPNPLFWLSIGTGVLILLWCLEHFREFLAQWVLLFFGAALVLFFAGSARYLLPLAFPLAVLVSNRLHRRWLYAGIGLNLALGLLLAWVNYQHWDGYRQFARTLAHDAATKRVWINGEWGLRFYLEAEGGLPLLRGQEVKPGEMVVSSALAGFAVPGGGGMLTKVAEREITAAVPLRLVALNGRSAYSSVLFGLRPFDVSSGPIDRVRAEVMIAKQPRLGRLAMNAPEAAQQIVSGIYDLEGGQWRWTSGKAVVLLLAPREAEPIEVRLTVPGQSPARRVTIYAGAVKVAEQVLGGSGTYTIRTPPVKPEDSSVTITIAVDKTFSVPGDARELGVILSEVGFRGSGR